MNSKDIFNIIEKVPHYWEKRLGVFVVFSITLIFYFTYIYETISNDLFIHWWIKTLLIPIIIFIIIWLIWYFSTNRICFKQNSKKISFGVFINIDEKDSEEIIKKLIKKSISEITAEFKEIKVVLYPINYKTSIESIEKYLKLRNYCLDTIIYAKVESGNVTNNSNNNLEQKISIKELTFSGNFNMKENMRIFKDNVNMINDINISHHFKDWNYIEQNSYTDKSKIQNNFKETILHYSGLYLIYMQQENLALEIFKSLHNPQESKIKIISGSKETKITSKQLASARNNSILLNLFMHTALKRYHTSDDVKFPYEKLKECEAYFSKHTDSYNHYIDLARLAYQNGILSEAKEYTEKAFKHSGLKPMVIINKVFFTIIDNNIPDFITYLRKLNSKYLSKSNINFVDLIGFLENEKEKYPDSEVLFDFAIGYYFLFVDQNESKSILSGFKGNQKPEFKSLSLLATEILATLEKKPKTKNGIVKKKSKKRKRA
ncbi:hypothetical protein [Lentimicrobium sp. S6]|uniref:hypothetical protein n=1 Tax=Lentimicrobium sp. S6 TaxID=2735872 RepID=UPI001553CF23|nr:hypothetical protein [Lentimicrobium sp. S6]NPD47805.1 hypothetical protein [Lentimicrobium sp. S6]